MTRHIIKCPSATWSRSTPAPKVPLVPAPPVAADKQCEESGSLEICIICLKEFQVTNRPVCREIYRIERNNEAILPGPSSGGNDDEVNWDFLELDGKHLSLCPECFAGADVVATTEIGSLGSADENNGAAETEHRNEKSAETEEFAVPALGGNVDLLASAACLPILRLDRLLIKSNGKKIVVDGPAGSSQVQSQSQDNSRCEGEQKTEKSVWIRNSLRSSSYSLLKHHSKETGCQQTSETDNENVPMSEEDNKGARVSKSKWGLRSSCPNEIFKCDVCKKRFYSKSRLETHMKIHLEENSFQCKICKKEFSTKQGLMMHRKQHAVENQLKWECDICKKKFRLQKDLKTHRTGHTGENRFK